ncbi:sigma-54 interaction domain-containing protein [Desulfosporosinus sp. SB140]|uniref:sigma-54 interaction domain-containing protein n=1 Tax=Desulfosporosinus paludis TaxID=3115649 RepID=UPI00388D5C33
MREEDIQFLLGKRDEKVIEVSGKQVYTRFVPLDAGIGHRGEIVTIDEVSVIQDFERKIRLSLNKKGFYAKYVFDDILGSSELIHNAISKAIKFSKYNANVLIYGETGTGKELFAQSIHNESTRKSGPFVSVNCASIPPSLMESELFGYVEGAFTGARRGGKLGLFELAHGGTIFLDEIGELSFEIQGRLLRVLQEKEVMRIGDDKIIPIDTRVICATNKNLLEIVREGKFREDLYYRINVLKITLPALRERREDIRILFHDFIARYENEYGKRVTIEDKAFGTLEEYNWPGNIRELKNLAEKTIAFIDHKGSVTKLFITEMLNEECSTQKGVPTIVVPETGDLRTMEREMVKQLIARYGQAEVCRKYKINRTTLWRRINDPLR